MNSRASWARRDMPAASSKSNSFPRAQAMKPARLADLARATGAGGLLDRCAFSIPTAPDRHGLRAVAGGGVGRIAPATFLISMPVISSAVHRNGATDLLKHIPRRASHPSRRGKSAALPVGPRAGFASPAFSGGEGMARQARVALMDNVLKYKQEKLVFVPPADACSASCKPIKRTS